MAERKWILFGRYSSTPNVKALQLECYLDEVSDEVVMRVSIKGNTYLGRLENLVDKTLLLRPLKNLYDDYDPKDFRCTCDNKDEHIICDAAGEEE